MDETVRCVGKIDRSNWDREYHFQLPNRRKVVEVVRGWIVTALGENRVEASTTLMIQQRYYLELAENLERDLR